MSESVPDQSSFIIIGAWNASIIEPTWLKKTFPNIIRSTEFPVNVNIGTFRSISYQIDNMKLDASNGRLVFTPNEVNENNLIFIKDLASGIYEKLQHTPISASGCNFSYRLSEGEVFSNVNIEESENVRDFYNHKEIGGYISKEIKHKFSYANHTLTIIYKVESDLKTLQYNFEYKGAENLINATESIIENYNKTLEYNELLIGS